MFNVSKIRAEFPALKNKIQGHDMVYFDNAATFLKPQCVADKAKEYFDKLCANPHGDDYDIANVSFAEYNKAREITAKFLGADPEEIIFTAGCTASLNGIAKMLKPFLKKGDEIVISLAEHASNVLPWFELQKEIGVVVKYAPLNEKGFVTLDSVKSVVTDKTKIVSLAQVSNVLGYEIDVKSIAEYVHSKGIIVVTDGAQSAPHIKVNVHDLGCDFFTTSGHKLGAPTGIGALYIAKKWLDKLDPYQLGGGMNARFDKSGNYSYVNVPNRFEAGTQNVIGVICLGKAIEYLLGLGMDEIAEYEYELKQYAVKKLKEIPGIVIYNEDSKSGIIAFNKDGVFSQDLATHYNSNGICVRSGNHCAKLLPEFLKTPTTVRASLGFYNTKDEVDYFVEVTKKGDDFLDAFFK